MPNTKVKADQMNLPDIFASNSLSGHYATYSGTATNVPAAGIMGTVSYATQSTSANYVRGTGVVGIVSLATSALSAGNVPVEGIVGTPPYATLSASAEFVEGAGVIGTVPLADVANFAYSVPGSGVDGIVLLATSALSAGHVPGSGVVGIVPLATVALTANFAPVEGLVGVISHVVSADYVPVGGVVGIPAYAVSADYAVLLGPSISANYAASANIATYAASALKRPLYLLLGTGLNQFSELGYQPLSTSDPYRSTSLYEILYSSYDDFTFSLGEFCSFMLKSNGDLYGCGSNDYSSLGIANGQSLVHEFTILPTPKFRKIISDRWHSVGITPDNMMYAIGENGNIMFSTGISPAYNDYTKTFVPVSAAPVSGIVSDVYLGYNTCFVKTTTNEIRVNGYNLWGEGAQGNFSTNPITGFSATVTACAASAVNSICSNLSSTVILKTDGTIMTCGLNTKGECGHGVSGTSILDVRPVTAAGVTGIQQAILTNYNLIVLKNDGTMMGVGYNQYGELGLGHTTPQLNWVTIPMSGVSSIYGREGVVYALKSDGSLFASGFNTWGALGNGTYSQYNRFTRVRNIYNIRNIDVTGGHCFIKTIAY